MENKKLINILIKDMQELEELIAEIKINEKLNAFEFEFIHTRAKGLLSLMNLLQIQEAAVPMVEEGKIPSPKQHPTPETEKAAIKEEPIIENIQETEEYVPEEKSETLVEKPIPEDEVKEEASEKNVKENLNEKVTNKNIEGIEPEEKQHKTLGDSFVSEKSLNDLLSESKNAQNSISNRPVSSLQSAVGINDRFLFIRELFEGDGDQYVKAVKNLDKMNSIQDAVSYLRDNFKWKKNDTSLKFIQLVKRRFAND